MTELDFDSTVFEDCVSRSPVGGILGTSAASADTSSSEFSAMRLVFVDRTVAPLYAAFVLGVTTPDGMNVWCSESKTSSLHGYSWQELT